MNCARVLISIFLMLFVGGVSARESLDSLILNRVYHYQKNYAHELTGYSTNFYSKFLYETHKRNFGLWLIPNMYTIATGDRTFLSEQYGRLHYYEMNDFDHETQVYYTTIPRNSKTMPILSEFMTPCLYNVLVYGDHILSPFHKDNRHYYRYIISGMGTGIVRLYFRPRFVKNTQLMSGVATINEHTGRIIEASFEGEYDMIKFHTIAMLGESGGQSLMPKYCRSEISFKFMGNHVTSEFEAVFDCPIRLPDSVNVKGDRALIDSVRPISLTAEELALYEYHEGRRGVKHEHVDSLALAEEERMAEGYEAVVEEPDTIIVIDELNDSAYLAALNDTSALIIEQRDSTAILAAQQDSLNLQMEMLDSIPQPVALTDTTALASAESTEEKPRKYNFFRDFDWSLIGDHLLQAHRAESSDYYVKLSPILEPQYISYSASKGFAYKMKFCAEYYTGLNSGIYFNPNIGYNFKLKQFYFNVPLRYSYDNEKNNFVELLWRNGNRIGSGVVVDEIKNENGLAEVPADLDLFKDEEWRLYNNTKVSEKLTVEAGIVYHRREADNPSGMELFNKPTVYRSLAPSLGVHVRPWKRGPLFTVDYERAIKMSGFIIDYERWETDISHKYYMSSLTTINYRLGGGLYTRKNSNYFTDFANFRDNNLPEGWNDDWTGDFQLLDSRLYNESQYYVRSNISFESPLMVTAFLPFVGRYVDQERFYWSGLLIEHSRPYSELGYGFSSRYFSMGLFASFFNLQYQQFGTKFTFELFRRW